MTLKVYIEPTYTVPDRAEGGIRRVTEAMVKYLPQFGVESSDMRRADLTNGHGVMLPRKPGKHFISSCHGLYWEDYEWPSWAHEVNKLVTEALCQAQAITAPSQWVAHALTRALLRPPVPAPGPCHNLAHFLPAALDSVLRQPFTDWECWIVDDASQDETYQVADDYMRKDLRFRYVKPLEGENIGLSRALTLGANESRGRFIVNLDADNLLGEDALSECVRELEQNPDLHIAYGALDVMNALGGERRRNAWPTTFDWRLQ